MFCANCGKEVEDNIVFCPECGKRVQGENVEAVVETNSVDVNSNPEVTVEEAVVNEGIVAEAEAENNSDTVGQVAAQEENAQPMVEQPENIQPVDNVQKEETHFCPKCGAPSATGVGFCAACGAKLGKKKKEINVDTSYLKVPLFRYIAIGVAAVLVLGIVIFATMSINKKSTLIYLKDEDILEKAGKEIVEVGSRLYDGESGYVSVTISDDGKYLFYPQKIENGLFDLYYKVVGDTKNEGVKIASDVYDYQVTKNNIVVFRNDEKNLYRSDLKDKEKIASNIKGYYRISEDGSQVLYNDDENRIYVRDINLKKDKIKVASDMNILYISDDFDTLICSDEDEDLYVIKNLEDKSKFASEVDSCYFVEDGDKLQVIYAINDDSSDEVDISGLIFDDMAEADANMEEPDIYNYQRTEIVDSFWGPRENTYTDEKYYEDYQKYQEKLKRDRLRKELASYLNLDSNKEIKVYDVNTDEKSDLFKGAVTGCRSYGKLLGIQAYSENEGAYAKLSEFENMDYDEKIKKIDKIKNQASTFGLYNMKELVYLNIDEDYRGRVENYWIDDSKNEIYFRMLCDGDDFYLCKTNYKNGKGEVELLSEDFINNILFANGKIIYTLCDKYTDDTCELYYDGELISTDCYRYNVVLAEDNKTVVFMEDVDKNGNGDLVMYNGKKTKIASDVHVFYTGEGNNVAYIADYNRKKQYGDLYEYKSNKAVKIDEDVTMILYY